MTAGLVYAGFIMQESGRVIGLDPASGILKGFTVAGFITHGPHNDAGIIFITDYISLIAVQYGLGEHFHLNYGAVVVIARAIKAGGAVGLQVAFRDDIEAELIAQAANQGALG